MRRRVPRTIEKSSELMLSPMIDLIFLLLVFFIISTMHMVDLKTIPVKLPIAESSVSVSKSSFTVTVKKDGSIYLDEQRTDLAAIVTAATKESKHNHAFSVIVRADGDVDYKKVVHVLDELKLAGVKKFGLATEYGGKK